MALLLGNPAGAKLPIPLHKRHAYPAVFCASAPPKTAKGTVKRTIKQRQGTQTVSSRTARGTRSQPSPQSASKQSNGSRFYFNFTGFPFPLGPFFERRTVRNEVRQGAVGRGQRGQGCGGQGCLIYYKKDCPKRGEPGAQYLPAVQYSCNFLAR